MEESYIRGYIVNLLENTYTDSLERLKAISYGIESILESIEQNIETNNDKSNYNKLTTCLLTINEIIKEEDAEQTIAF